MQIKPRRAGWSEDVAIQIAKKQRRGVESRGSASREDVVEQAPRKMFIARMKRGGFDEYNDAAIKHYKEKDEIEIKKRTVYTRGVASRDRLFDEDEVEGDKKVAQTRRLMRSMGLVQTKVLRDIHGAMIMTNLHNFYGKDFLRCLPRLLKAYKQEEFYQMWIVTTMRQAGKTSAVQSGCAALILVLNNFKFVVFAPTKRQSQVIMTGTVDFIRLTPDGGSRIVSGGRGEELIVTPLTGGEMSKINPKNNILRCLPATEKG